MAVRKPVLPDMSGRTLGWREWFITGSQWLFRPLPKTVAELEAIQGLAKRPKSAIRLNPGQ